MQQTEFKVPPLSMPGDKSHQYISSNLIPCISKMAHSATIAETERGLCAAWFGGDREGKPGVKIYFSRKDNGDDKWQLPEAVAEVHNRPCWNPVLSWQESAKRLWLFYKAGESPDSWHGVFKVSLDCGHSWSLPCNLGWDLHSNKPLIGPVKNKPIWISAEDFLCPSSREASGYERATSITPHWTVHVERYSETIENPKTIAHIESNGISAIQPTILVHQGSDIYGDQLQVLCRTKKPHGKIAHSWSSHEGKGWSALSLLDLPNPNSGFDAVSLADGRQLLVYNHSVKTHSNFRSGRHVLNVALSQGSRTECDWLPIVTLEHEEANDGYEFSYPSVIQAKNGNVHIVYSWNRMCIKHVVLSIGSIS